MKLTIQIERCVKIKNNKARKNFHFVHVDQFDQYSWDGPQDLLSLLLLPNEKTVPTVSQLEENPKMKNKHFFIFLFCFKMKNETLWNILMSMKLIVQIERSVKIKNKKTRKNFHFVHVDHFDQYI